MPPRTSTLVIVFLVCAPVLVFAQAPVTYHLSIPEPQHHWMQVELTLPWYFQMHKFYGEAYSPNAADGTSPARASRASSGRGPVTARS